MSLYDRMHDIKLNFSVILKGIKFIYLSICEVSHNSFVEDHHDSYDKV